MPTQQVEATLQVELPDTTLAPLLANADRHLVVLDEVAHEDFVAMMAEMVTLLHEGGTVALSPATLAALESIQATVTGTVTVSNLPGTQAVTGTVALDAGTLAALETINAAVTGTVALDAPTLAALENVIVTGSVTVSGTVAVSNFPATQVVSDGGDSLTVDGTVAVSGVAGSVAVTGPLTDAQLRATPVPVTGTVTASIGTVEVTNDAGNPLPVSGTVAVTATDLDVRPLAVDADSVGTRSLPVTPTSGSVAAVVTDQALITPAAGQRLRLRRIHLHMDPEAAAGVYNTVTLKLGATTVFSDKFEPGLPFAEELVVLGANDAPLTITTSGTARIYFNLRTNEESP